MKMPSGMVGDKSLYGVVKVENSRNGRLVWVLGEQKGEELFFALEIPRKALTGCAVRGFERHDLQLWAMEPKSGVRTHFTFEGALKGKSEEFKRALGDQSLDFGLALVLKTELKMQIFTTFYHDPRVVLPLPKAPTMELMATIKAAFDERVDAVFDVHGVNDALGMWRAQVPLHMDANKLLFEDVYRMYERLTMKTSPYGQKLLTHFPVFNTLVDQLYALIALCNEKGLYMDDPTPSELAEKIVKGLIAQRNQEPEAKRRC